MNHIQAGNILLPQVGLGTYTHFGEVMSANVSEAKRLGYTFFDTALVYQNESDLAQALDHAGYGADVIVQTKVPPAMLVGSKERLRLDRVPVRRAIGISEKNLQGRPVSIYLLHCFCKHCDIPYRKLIRLQQSGRVGAIGICNCGIAQLELLKDKAGAYPMILQTEVHPYYSQKPLLEFCRRKGIVVEARSPFAHGDVMPEWERHPVLKGLASEYDKTIPQIILRWLVQQGLVVLPRTTNLRHMHENIGLFDFELTSLQMQQIDDMNMDRSFGCKSQLLNI